MRDLESFYGIGEDYFAERSCAYTAREIAQQPELFDKLCRILLDKKNDIASFMKRVGDLKQTRIIFTGAGSSAFIGDALTGLIAKNTALKTESIHTTDIVTAPSSYLFADTPTLLISFARSGNSPESTGAVKYARSAIRDLYEIAILCDKTSALHKLTAESDKSLIIPMPEAANDKGFAMTSSVSCMQLAGYSLFMIDKLAEIVLDIALLAKNLSAAGLEYTKAAQKWAGRDFDRIVYLGCGFLKHIAHEASLKMMELTAGKVNGAYESATGFRHGPKSVINDTTLTVHIISGDPFTAKYDLDLLKEVCGQQRSNMVLAICKDGLNDIPGDDVIKLIPDGYTVASDVCAGIETLVFCQMLAMFKSLSLKIATDDPAPSGVVNRVVKGVTIYDYEG